MRLSSETRQPPGLQMSAPIVCGSKHPAANRGKSLTVTFDAHLYASTMRSEHNSILEMATPDLLRVYVPAPDPLGVYVPTPDPLGVYVPAHRGTHT